MPAESFTPAEQALLAPFVTDLHAPIFGLRNLPEVVRGALFSRYSRSDKSLRRILLDEFIQAPESGFAEIVGGAQNTGTNQMVATQRAEAFYERVLVGYGDDSVAELGGAHVACEGISNIAAKVIEDSRIGISPLEKSTRYVLFNQQVDGRFRYVRAPQIMASPHAARYEGALDGLFTAYSALLEPTIAWVQAQTPRDAATTERAYRSATRAKACDILRGLLPLATETNVGLFGNGRAFEYLLTKLYASPFEELNAIGGALQEALDALIPSFVKRAKNQRGQEFQAYLRGMRDRVTEVLERQETRRDGDKETTAPSFSMSPDLPVSSSVRLVAYDPDAEWKTVAAILYPHSALPLDELRVLARQLGAEERAAIVRAYVGERASRFHKPGRAFEEPVYTFDILADIGAYRDIQRHRLLTQDRQAYTVAHGFITPPELEDAGLAEPYAAALNHAADLFAALHASMPDEAQYAVPLAFRMRWRMTMNLREAYHLCELRSAPQGHPTYRRIAQDAYAQIRAVHPLLAEGMRFVDTDDYALERLAAEQRLDAKMERGRSKLAD